MTKRDWHVKPPEDVRSVADALKDAERMRRELPQIVQVFARDWDQVILADAILEHNAGCDSSCAAQRPNERESGGCGYQDHDGSLIYPRRCPTCPKDWKIYVQPSGDARSD